MAKSKDKYVISVGTSISFVRYIRYSEEDANELKESLKMYYPQYDVKIERC